MDAINPKRIEFAAAHRAIVRAAAEIGKQMA